MLECPDPCHKGSAEVPFLRWMKEKARKRYEARERQRELKELALEPKLEEHRKTVEEELQRRKNILAILNDNKLPEIDWSPLGPMPFEFLESEHLIYVFPEVRYADQCAKPEAVERSSKASIRVTKGATQEAGGSRETAAEGDLRVDHGMGILAVTDQHLYFNGQRSLRVRMDTIVSVRLMANAVEVTRDRPGTPAEYFLLAKRDANLAYEILRSVPSLKLPSAPEREDPSDYHSLVPQGDPARDSLEE